MSKGCNFLATYDLCRGKGIKLFTASITNHIDLLVGDRTATFSVDTNLDTSLILCPIKRHEFKFNGHSALYSKLLNSSIYRRYMLCLLIFYFSIVFQNKYHFYLCFSPI